MTTSHPAVKTRQRLVQAGEHLSEVHRIVDEVGPEFEEPARGAALLMRAEIASLQHRLTNLAFFVHTEEATR